MITPTEIDLKREISNVLYITGLVTKGRTLEEIEEFLTSVDFAHTELNHDATSLGGGRLWVCYESIDQAQKAQAVLHQQSYKGCTIMCRFELGWDPETGKRLVSRKSIHTTPIRKIDTRRGEGKKNTNSNDGKNEKNISNYSFKSLSIGQTEFPFPSGLYLGRLLSLVSRWQNQEHYQKNDPIIYLLSNNYTWTVIFYAIVNKAKLLAAATSSTLRITLRKTSTGKLASDIRAFFPN